MLVMARVDQLIEKYTAMRDMYKQFNTEGAIATVKLCDEVLQDLRTEKRLSAPTISIDWDNISQVIESRNNNTRTS